MKRDMISILDFENEIDETLDLAIKLKSHIKSGKTFQPLKGKHMGMIFEKPSLRTRISFEIGFSHLGGTALYLSPSEIQMGKRESVFDVARVISRYVDIIMYRAFSNKIMCELAKFSDVPVINGLDDLEHPCQIMADFMTIKEQKGSLKGLKLVYIGDGNNVCNSLLLGSAAMGMHMTVTCPLNYEPDNEVFARAQKLGEKTGSKIKIVREPDMAVMNADVIYTDTWVSMGDEAEKEERLKVFPPFQVNKKLVANAKPDYIFLHCLPAHRNEEVTDEIIDSLNSKVFDEAENRMWAQMAVIIKLLAPDAINEL
ncbi:MAG: ornithine carbamoyltransferase [Candidatus Thermoplasmatota archaeon]|nr:ornithine carbamoyltransferase [Euryarchaeota archaeon]MBU4031648.1 ornithine carbamoyltransferase [Candidatus Thermoplasmatota archaeon]MBU4072355.1 ornithine carbamoyltransferase [Candidatus Thermoplasmatota archaeon]MBU4144190.1 ornithine carbamoyltransferase [Candidatus Thermoplasmatota archaeon]MBU4591518.1 ornithine carbamoyltransferase [Candidatus Thermoplasmatota archaeon]